MTNKILISAQQREAAVDALKTFEPTEYQDSRAMCSQWRARAVHAVLNAAGIEVRSLPEVCGSTGPRVGETRPRCGGDLDHEGPHRGFPGSGFEDVFWGAPLLRDEAFAREYRAGTH